MLWALFEWLAGLVMTVIVLLMVVMGFFSLILGLAGLGQ
jgi:hypothetical protein